MNFNKTTAEGGADQPAPVNFPTPNISLGAGLTLELGDHSYIHGSEIKNPSGALTHIKTGKFSSIATDLTIVGYDHHSEWVAMYPFLDDGHRVNWPGTNGIPYPQSAQFGSNKSRGDILIGNDVWIGCEVKLFKGVTLGDGVVIGACSLVNKSVEPYTIVAGIPARPIRKRFSDPEIALLQKIKWWDLPVTIIDRHMALLCSSNIAGLEKALELDPEYHHYKSGAAHQNGQPLKFPAMPSPQPIEIQSNRMVTIAPPDLAGHARKKVEQFLADARQQFAEVEPPPLSEWHLKNSRILTSRQKILERMPKGGVGAEIGTQTGNFAREIMTIMQPTKLHIFDLDFTPFDHAPFQTALQQGVVELHQGDSSALLAALPDSSFDFIYIDGDHAYDGVVKDLAQAARKIKADGWIVCNDYTLYSPLEQMKYGVYRAVNEFCWEHGFEIIYLGLHPWSYHDVALRKMKPEDVAQAATHRPPLRPRTVSTVAVTSAPANKSISLPMFNAMPAASPAVHAVTEPTRGDNVIATIGAGDEMFTGDKTHYFGVGKSALHGVESALLAANKPPTSIRNILDLPCGHGRVMRFFKAAFPQAQITACDLNRGAVDFCAKTFAAQPVYSNVDVSRIPLTGKFDLIWSGSLLTHLRAPACADFIRLFSSLVNPGGLILFTLHGRWVERSLATNRYTYGLRNPDVAALLKEYYATGFGYADYPGVAGYGISVSSPAFVLSQLVSLPDLKLISYHEKGWDNHQDIVCLQKQLPHEPLG